jgi:AraC-like DNA-binding protein
MFLSFEDRTSDSPFVERIWRCRSSRAGRFSSVAANHWEIVVARLHGEATLTVRGPETRATRALAPGDGEWVAIRFRPGTFMPQLPIASLLDRQDVTLPRATKRSFWLDGSAWEYPSFDNAEVFVRRLVRVGRIVREPVVDDVIQRRPLAISTRTAQRRFVRATGLTYRAFRQTERARHATDLLRSGVPIADVVHDAGYFDQPHLTRSLKRLIGLTPCQIVAGEQQLSFLYKTTPA